MLLLGYYVIPDWLEEQLQRWEDPIIKLAQQLFLNFVGLIMSRLISGESIHDDIVTVHFIIIIILGKLPLPLSK